MTPVNYTEDAVTSMRIDSGLDAIVADANSANFNGGSLTAAISSGFVAARDRIQLIQDSVVSVTGNTVTVNGAAIGTITPTGTGTDRFTISFDADAATPAAVQEVVRHIAYANGSQDPVAGTRGITPTLVDGDGTVDGGQDTVVVTSSVDVVAVNDAPVGTDGTVTLNEDTPTALTAANFDFTDAENNALQSVTITTMPTAGTLTFDADGTGPGAPVAVTAGQVIAATDIAAGKLVFTPALDANGTVYASLTFQVQDNGGTTNGGVDTDSSANTLTFDVTPVNYAPVAPATGIVQTAEDTASAPTAIGASDVDRGDTLTYAVTGTGPAHGTIGFAPGAGTFTYTPTANYNGTDTFTVRRTDAGGLFADQVVTATITAVADLTGRAETAITAEDASLSNTLATGTDGTANDTPTSGGALTYAASTTPDTGPAHGTVTIGSDGGYTYAPTANYNGSDTFAYTVTDAASGESVTRTATITVTPVNDVASTQENTPVSIDVLRNDRNVDAPNGTTVTIRDLNAQGSASAANGAVNGVSIGNDATRVVFDPNAYTAAGRTTAGLDYLAANQTLDVLIDYSTISSAGVRSTPDHSTVTVTVTGVNDAPMAARTNTVTPEDAASAATAIGATDVDQGDTLAYAVTGAGPAHGAVAFDQAAGTFIYTPVANYNGTDTFTVRTTDKGGLTADQVVTATVTAAPDLTGKNEAATTREDMPLSDSVAKGLDGTANDITTSGGTLS